jgi:myo-inositol 2-dehydrogenase/D-chiro-inositol 1-dehydrogenase
VPIDRRTFLLAPAVSLAAQESRQIRTAAIGIGNRGTALLQQVLANSNARVTAVCDIDPQARDKAASVAARHNPRVFDDYRRVLDLADVDAVTIASPCDLHAPMAAAALSAGKYVYCEKPVGITPDQVQSVVNAARGSKGFLQIGQQLRYFPDLREVIRQIHDRVHGNTLVVKAQRHSSATEPGKERPRAAWYDDVKRSGDLIVENAVHNIDVCNWIVNSRPVSAYGHGKKYFPKPIPAGTLMMDGFSVEYIYENDVHLDYSQLYMHPRGLKELAGGQWYIAFGDKGSVNVSKGLFYPMHSTNEPKDLLTPELRSSKEKAMEDFFACILEKRKPFADITVAATAALTAILGREAIYRRKSVDWKDLGVTI